MRSGTSGSRPQINAGIHLVYSISYKITSSDAENFACNLFIYYVM